MEDIKKSPDEQRNDMFKMMNEAGKNNEPVNEIDAMTFEGIKRRKVNKEKIMIHAASGFNKTICGILFNSTVPCRMTNVYEEVTCPDCVTIIKIWEKNEIRRNESDKNK